MGHLRDAAKAFGYEKLEASLPRTVTVGRAHPAEVRKAEIREVMSGLGYLETMPFTLTNEKVHFEWMRRSADAAVARATHVLHPISELHTILRTSLLSCLLEILALISITLCLRGYLLSETWWWTRRQDASGSGLDS